MTEEKITKEGAVAQVVKSAEWMQSFIEEKDLMSEFALWIAENRTEEITDMVGTAFGSKTGESLAHLIGVMKDLDKEA